MTSSLTRDLAALIRAKPITTADRHACALFVLDAVANGIGGRGTAQGRIVLDWAQAAGGDAGRRAFTQGALIHILEMDDLHRASVVHPGCVVVPAAVAVARDTGAMGHAVLDAVLRGFEACCRVGMSVGPSHYKVWHNTATCGPFGSAMAAADLLGLDTEQTMHALGNAGTQAAGVWEFLDTGAMSKHLHAGRGAEAGVVAAQLAARGFSGPPRILEGARGFYAAACPDPHPGAVLADRDAPWQLRLTSIKPWPSCRHTHPAIDAALELAASGPIDGPVTVTTYRTALDVCDNPAPDSIYAAKFSLQHCVTAALSDGKVDFASFEPDARARLADAAERVTLIAADPFDGAYPVSWGARVQAGNRVAERTAAKGDPEAPLSDAEMTDKARMLMNVGGHPEPDAVISAVLALADDGPVAALGLV